MTPLVFKREKQADSGFIILCHFSWVIIFGSLRGSFSWFTFWLLLTFVLYSEFLPSPSGEGSLFLFCMILSFLFVVKVYSL